MTGLQGNGLGNDFGIGGRFTYTYSEHDDSEIGTVSALEAEINLLPVNKSPDVFHGGRALLALAGITESVGDTSERIGIKLGTGFVRSSNAVTRLSQATDGSLTPARFGVTTNPVLDLGVLVEAYPRNHHWGFRVDVGDLLAFYPNLPARGFRVRHQLAASIALNYHFLSKSKRKQHSTSAPLWRGMSGAGKRECGAREAHIRGWDQARALSRGRLWTFYPGISPI